MIWPSPVLSDATTTEGGSSPLKRRPLPLLTPEESIDSSSSPILAPWREVKRIRCQDGPSPPGGHKKRRRRGPGRPLGKRPIVEAWKRTAEDLPTMELKRGKWGWSTWSGSSMSSTPPTPPPNPPLVFQHLTNPPNPSILPIYPPPPPFPLSILPSYPPHPPIPLSILPSYPPSPPLPLSILPSYPPPSIYSL